MSNQRGLLQRSTAVTTVSSSVKRVLLLIPNVRFGIICLSRHGHVLVCESKTHTQLKRTVCVCVCVRVCVRAVCARERVNV